MVYYAQDCVYIVAAYGNPEKHRHFASHLLIGLNGSLEVMVGDERIKNAGIVTGSNVPHRILSGGSTLVIFVPELTAFSDLIKRKFLTEREFGVLADEEAEEIRRCWKQAEGLENMEISGNEMSEDRKSMNGQEMPSIWNVERAIRSTEEVLGFVYGPSGTADQRVLEAAAYINSARDLDILTAEEISMAVHLSASRLSHLFKTETGCSLKLYLANIKMRRAIHLLLKGKTIMEACMDAGFASPSHFADTSRKMYGMPAKTVAKSLHPVWMQDRQIGS